MEELIYSSSQVHSSINLIALLKHLANTMLKLPIFQNTTAEG